ncbi:hypothetical protein COR50_11475 [Chitinophaga caeni]|uniref:Lipoprotein n=2 Tax=Chitinophaga caeni TaxID=2029983 RepID=A0A291QV61_9BACT|nr:hypothetical protein COR50_11475 [Chitinophaga caeni]
MFNRTSISIFSAISFIFIISCYACSRHSGSGKSTELTTAEDSILQKIRSQDSNFIYTAEWKQFELPGNDYLKKVFLDEGQLTAAGLILYTCSIIKESRQWTILYQYKRKDGLTGQGNAQGESAKKLIHFFQVCDSVQCITTVFENDKRILNKLVNAKGQQPFPGGKEEGELF